MIQYILYLHFHSFSLDFAQFSIQKLQQYILENVDINSKIINDTTIQLSFEEESPIVKQVLEFFLYFSHPFYSITTEKNQYDEKQKKGKNLDEEDLFSNILSHRKYALHSINEQARTLPLFLELQFQIHNTLPEDIEQIKFVNPFVEYNALPIEQLLFYSYQFQNISNRSLISNYKLSLPQQKTLYSRINASMHAIVQSQLQLKRLKEEGTKAGVKMRVSILDFDYLDVKFHKDDFDVVVSSFLKITKEEFGELISQYLYQAEFISKYLIGILTIFPIEDSLLKKYNLKIKKYKEINHLNNSYYLYIISKKSS